VCPAFGTVSKAIAAIAVAIGKDIEFLNMKSSCE
jgi:hypothetical protein